MHAVIGAFDNSTQARRAMDLLVQAGFDPGDVHFEQGTPDLASGNRGLDTGHRRKGITGFLASLFTSEDQANTGHAHTFQEAVRRGSSLVLVDAREERDAERACTILHEAGAVDVDERAKQWRTEGWSGTAGTGHPLDRGGVRVLPHAGSKQT